MDTQNTFDVCIIGAGPAGLSSIRKASATGYVSSAMPHLQCFTNLPRLRVLKEEYRNTSSHAVITSCP